MKRPIHLKNKIFSCNTNSSQTLNQNEKQKFETFSTELLFVQNLKLNMILKKFLKFLDFESCDTYKKNSYKNNCVIKITLFRSRK